MYDFARISPANGSVFGGEVLHTQMIAGNTAIRELKGHKAKPLSHRRTAIAAPTISNA